MLQLVDLRSGFYRGYCGYLYLLSWSNLRRCISKADNNSIKLLNILCSPGRWVTSILKLVCI
jgi:hypothetical protein